MPLNISAIYANTSPGNYATGVWLSVTGATAGNVLGATSYPGGDTSMPTAGYSSAISSGTALVPVEVYYGNYSVNVTTVFAGANPNYFRVQDVTSAVTAGAVGSSAATFNDRGSWVVSQGSTGNITITCTITTAYIAGTDSDKASVTLATRGVCTILFISGTVCVITGNVS